MATFWYILVVVIVLVLIWFLVSLIWGKPWFINHFYARVFLRFATESPELLTMLGMLEKLGLHGHNAKLADASIAHETKQFQRLKLDLKILRSYDRRRQSKAQLLSTDILDWFLDDQSRTERFRFHDYPLNQMFGIQSELPSFMMTMHPLINKVEAHNYVRRLSKFRIKFDQVMEGLLAREQKGVIPPRFVIRRVLDEITAFVNQPARQNPLWTVYQEKLGKLKISEAEKEALLAAVEAEIEKTVYPAYQKFIQYFTELEAKATTDDGVWKLPDGDAYYVHCLRSSTTTEMTPEQVHEIGLREVERIEGEIKAILRQLGYDEVENAPQKLREFSMEERFLYPDTAEGRAEALAEYQRILDHVNANLDPVFDIRPKAVLKVERVPEFREKTSAGAYYQPADLGGGRPGVFYANLRDMKEVPKFGMKTLSYHEGIPGHHFQIAIAQELRGVPFFRRLVPFTAYAEGWALYAEKLTRECGFYKEDPYGELGYLDSELFRAVRLVVDTGIHYKHWTREQAIEYMQQHTGNALESIVSEVERYIVMPGQACAYKVGEIKMVELRDRARTALGDRFDLRQFHNVVLKNGSMPLSLLEQVINDYIAAAP
ncbi:MAG: DUF885 domain-containing protein [Anaerolineales bacterium]|nr:DUF885 domain-containing protein [Anaerolineales bacterium]